MSKEETAKVIAAEIQATGLVKHARFNVGHGVVIVDLWGKEVTPAVLALLKEKGFRIEGAAPIQKAVLVCGEMSEEDQLNW